MPKLTFLTTITITSTVTGEGGTRFLRIPVEAFFAFLAFLCRSIFHGRSDVALLRWMSVDTGQLEDHRSADGFQRLITLTKHCIVF